MPTEPASEINLRRATKEDAAACGQICYNAFGTLNPAHGFPTDFPAPEIAIGALTMMFSHPDFYCLVAESAGKILGSNCLDLRSSIAGIGPISIDPAAQNAGVGRALMRAVIDYANARKVPGIRLVQAAYHNRSLSLYASLGFDIQEPLSCMQGRTRERNVPGCSVRAAISADMEACNALARRVHGFDRAAELSEAVGHGTARVVERGARITGYATDLAFFSHAVAETNVDLQALIASTESFGGPGILVPSRNNALFRWCLENGLRVTQPMTLMSMGLYNQPSGAWLPSVTF